ncbi:MAG: zinc metalloprotease [Planctomycetes bacterium]|nr:zinc metalloprotease [Planctomycetota bacterium]
MSLTPRLDHLGRIAFGAALLAVAIPAQHPTLQRCGTVLAQNPIGGGIDHPDCDYYQTNPSSAYAPTSLLQIPVVVHVIQSSSGTGNLSTALVQSQITVLNEDFRAVSGTAGANGTDTQIEFHLATTDPNGQPTTGIVHYTNNNWFNDSGNYYGSTAWDTSRYLNIYTNTASGYLGYVPDLPQGGSVLGTSADRVVCNYSAFGRPGLGGAPYHLGRTATHEVGHFLGLFHTFEGGCAGGSCYTAGDRICDTAAESQPRYGCPTSSVSCGSADPIRNYLDYTDDSCMQGFTAEQARRMRCTLQHYRPQLAQPAGPLASAVQRSGAGNLNANLISTLPRLGSSPVMTAITTGTPFSSVIVYGFLGAGTAPFQGYTILVDTASPMIMLLPLQTSTVYVQWTYSIPNNTAFAGLPIHAQGVMLGSSSFGLTNAVDLVLGS